MDSVVSWFILMIVVLGWFLNFLKKVYIAIEERKKEIDKWRDM